MTALLDLVDALAPADVHSSSDCLVARCDYAAFSAAVCRAGTQVDALITDPPYSSRTHEGHGDMARSGELGRRDIDYSSWSARDVEGFVAAWHPLVSGWACALTDHVLVPDWERAYGAAYRYSFSPISCVESGSRVRMLGDGPAQWSTFLCVARPRTASFAKWGALPGAYVVGAERKPVEGGKPERLMRALVRDYSRPGDVVCDPCAGGGTTLVAAIELGRVAIGCEPDPERYEIAVRRCREARRPLPGMEPAREQMTINLPEDR